MTYDAVLVARRGLGPAEIRLADPTFLDAVRWAVFAERAAPELASLREIVATDPPKDLAGADRTAFMANRSRAREQLADLEAVMFPEDADG